MVAIKLRYDQGPVNNHNQLTFTTPTLYFNNTNTHIMCVHITCHNIYLKKVVDQGTQSLLGKLGSSSI